MFLARNYNYSLNVRCGQLGKSWGEVYVSMVKIVKIVRKHDGLFVGSFEQDFMQISSVFFLKCLSCLVWLGKQCATHNFYHNQHLGNLMINNVLHRLKTKKTITSPRFFELNGYPFFHM